MLGMFFKPHKQLAHNYKHTHTHTHTRTHTHIYIRPYKINTKELVLRIGRLMFNILSEEESSLSERCDAVLMS